MIIIINKYFIKILLLLSIPLIVLNNNIFGITTGSTTCIFNNILGINCFGCGITHAVIEAVNGNFVQSINYNFNVIIVFPVLIFLWCKQLYRSFLELINNYLNWRFK